MSQIFDPSRNNNVGDSRPHRGFVTRLEELPVADAKYFGVVVFCSKDKHFYECQHVINETQDYYRWIAVTSGAERTFFIPVESLTDYEVPPGTHPSARTNSFDAIASAINEIALGLYRYNINTYPMGYVPCYDSVYVDGKKYYVWNDRYDRGFRTGYIITEDEQPIQGKPYYLNLPGYNEDVGIVSVRTIFFNEGDVFPQGSVVYESARPLMIPDAACVAGAPITHKVFVSDGTPYDQLTKVHLVAKANEIIDIINMTHAKLDRATDDGTLYDLATIVNRLIDELNPFATPFNNIMTRLESLERRVATLEQLHS